MHKKTLPEIAYPEELRRREAQLVSRRRGKVADQNEALLEAKDPIGIAVSGGGVRSATFALGVFQAFAQRGFLRRVDYLSTVSGGGYFGGFLAGLFARDHGENEQAGEPDDEAQAKKDPKQRAQELVEQSWRDVERRLLTKSDEVQYLRENGRYLAPAGSDDLWLGASVLLRNWVAVQLVLACAVLFVWEILELLVYGARSSDLALSPNVAETLHAAERLAASHGIALSPLWVIPPLLIALGSLPLGWAYWLAGYGGLPRILRHFLRGIVRARAEAGGQSADWRRAGYERIDGWDRWLNKHPKLGTYVCAGVCCAIIEYIWLRGVRTLSDVPLPAALALWVTCAAYAAETVSYRGTRDHRAFTQLMVFGGFIMTAGAYWVVFGLVHVAIDLAASFAAKSEHSVHDMFARCTAMTTIIAVCFVYLRLVLGSLYRRLVRVRQQRLFPGEPTLSPEDEQHFARYSVSYWLMRFTFLCAAFTVLALIHSAGATLYVQLGTDAAGFLSSVAAALLGVAAAGRKVSVWLSGPHTERRPPWFGTAIAYVIGYGLLLALLVVLSATSSVLVYGEATPLALSVKAVMLDCRAGSLLVPDATSTSYSLLAFGLISVVFGSSHLFLNSSTHLPLYASRITRTFLGASNPRRTENAAAVEPRKNPRWLPSALGWTGKPDASEVASGKAATQLMPGDDIAPERYWREQGGPYDRGAPLHIINVTINETVDGRSQTQQADRKGLAMAVGPCGMSAGVQHHAVLDWSKPVNCHVTCGQRSFVVFNYSENLEDHEHWLEQGVQNVKEGVQHVRSYLSKRPELQRKGRAQRGRDAQPASSDFKHVEFAGETLSIGQWLGISGAAFTTGLGFRTNSGLSLLAGLANIRLGYWWDSGVKRPWSLRRMVGIFFWTHHYLRRELLARFPGTANRLWYLSDGGHFENTGAYELIRRELPFIIVVDAEEDPEYGLEGLGNLVRKARLDFGAEIEFLDNDAIDGCRQLASKVRGHVGALSELARGDWERTDALHLPPRDDAASKQHRLASADVTKRSIAHASLARITYASRGSDGERSSGLLLYIKPTLTGDEPADVLRYHAEHPSFPHEPTLDQFFAESQWESYRSLGQHIGEHLCPGALGPFVTASTQPSEPAKLARIRPVRRNGGSVLPRSPQTGGGNGRYTIR